MTYQTIGMGSSGSSPSGTIKTIQESEATEVDYVDENMTYIGKATPGASASAPMWKIQKVISNGGDISIFWANGNSDSDKIWDNRLSYTYS